jgi:hypothetical protein
MRRHLIAASVIASFGAMLLAVPVIRRLHLQDSVVCPFHALTGFPCPTCGYTRVFALLQSGRLVAAIQLQPFVLLLAGLSGVAAVLAGVSIWRKKDLALPRPLVSGIWISLALSWVWNLYHGI